MKAREKKCPYCGKEMELGTVQSPYEIAWIKGTKKHVFGTSEFREDSIVLSEQSFLTGSAVIAHLCRDCQKVVIDYGNADHDLNNR